MSFIDDLHQRWFKHNTLICVGFDPDLARIPAHFGQGKDAILAWGKTIVDQTADLCCAYKPQIAHFAALGAEDVLLDLIRYIKEVAPQVPVILDSKRGDIGTTAERYAVEAFERFQADAVTINPYLGVDSIAPFTSYRDKGVIVLCRTTNPSAVELQNMRLENGRTLYQQVAYQAAGEWNEHGNLGLVVGATWPKEMSEIRAIVGDMPFLVPGLGAQGGDAAEVMKRGKTADGAGLIISSSRAIIFASQGEDFAESVRQATLDLQQQISSLRAL